MEITDLGINDSIEPPIWEKGGDQLLFLNSLFAFLGCIPLCFSRKPRAIVWQGSTPPPVVESASLPEILRCAPPVKETVDQLWTQIGEGSVSPSLWFLGNKLEEEYQLHPLPYLLALPRDRVRQAFQKQDFISTHVRIPAILGGIERGIVKALSSNKPAHWPDFWATLPLFAHHMQRDEARIRSLILAHKWQLLVTYLYLC